MTRYMRDKATGSVHALGRNEAKLFDGAPDGYEEVVVLPADTSRHVLELPEVIEEADAYSTGEGTDRLRTPKGAFSSKTYLRALEAFGLHNLAVVRHVMAQTEAAEAAAAERAHREAAIRVAEKHHQVTGRSIPLTAETLILDLLREGLIEEAKP
jgi:hypothetical protein